MSEHPTPPKYDDNAPFYRQPIFWMLMSGPLIVVVAAFISFGWAKTHAQEMVTDDYYKDGKHINLQLDRDQHAVDRKIEAQVMFNAEKTAAKVFISGDFRSEDGVRLILRHPAYQAEDRVITLKHESGNEFTAQFPTLPHVVHWYISVEDGKGVWRVHDKWLPSQGGAIKLVANVPSFTASAPAAH